MIIFQNGTSHLKNSNGKEEETVANMEIKKLGYQEVKRNKKRKILK